MTEDNPIEVLSRTVEGVRSATEAVPGERMVNKPSPDEWSARQVLAHLFDAEMVYGVRIRMILTADRPPIPAYDEDAWAARFSDLDETPRQIYLRWKWLREANLRLYLSITAEEWDRVGIHSERGEESVRMIVSLIASHDQAHLEQLQRILS
ncbi:MAG: DinB family protein [Actinomycetota bacterium]